jgi:predicted RNA-binding Zn ribbon-like protein
MTLPAWVPGEGHEQKPAPEPLLLVQSFVNTRDLDLGTDLLADAETANRWLRLCGLLSAGATAGPRDLRAAREARECIRALIARNGGGPEPADEDLGPLHAVTRAARPRLVIGRAGTVDLAPGPGGGLADGLVGLLVVIRDAQRDGTWLRLKVCGNTACEWAFYDRSHSRRGAWCDMASCGNLIKNRNLRARRVTRTGQESAPASQASATASQASATTGRKPARTGREPAATHAVRAD